MATEDQTGVSGKAYHVQPGDASSFAVSDTKAAAAASECDIDLDAEGKEHEHDGLWKLVKYGWFSHAGSSADAGLTSAAAQVGQVMLTLPHAVSLTGLRIGAPMIFAYTLVSMWTVHLLNALYLEHKRSKIKAGEWFQEDAKTKTRSWQYFEVLGHTCNKWLGLVALVITFINLMGNGLAQLVAGASNTYTLNNDHTKRTWTMMWGALSLLMTLVPTFRHFRLLNVIAIAGTAYTAIYIVVVCFEHGWSPHAGELAPYNFTNFFAGANVFLWAYGGHGVTFEIIDAMWKPSQYDIVYIFSYVFTFLVATPHSITTQLSFPKQNLAKDNVYGVMPKSRARDGSIVIMLVHQIVAYALYVTPVFFMWEKLLRVHNKPLWIRLPARIPVALLLWFLAILIPFYGLVNSIIGAFTGSMVSFVLPAFAYNWYYMFSPARRAAAPKQPPKWTGGWYPVLFFNCLVVIYFFTVGFCIGGYAAIRTLVTKVHQLGVFVACYQCN